MQDVNNVVMFVLLAQRNIQFPSPMLSSIWVSQKMLSQFAEEYQIPDNFDNVDTFIIVAMATLVVFGLPGNFDEIFLSKLIQRKKTEAAKMLCKQCNFGPVHKYTVKTFDGFSKNGHGTV